MDEKKLTPREVDAWIVEVDAELRAVAERLEPLLAEQRQLEERKLLLQSLRRSFEAASPNGASAAAPRTSGSVARYVVDRAVEILREAGGPMHINDLHAQFVERGFTVPGAGQPVNLTVHLRSSSEIASPMRGIYGLVEQIGPTPQQAARPKKRRSARSRARGRKG